jgi:ATP-binding cassette subfamily C (CFTR/MRP) protein 1
VVLWSLPHQHASKTSVSAAALSFVASMALLSLSNLEHTRSLQPSLLVDCYLLSTIILDLPQARTLFLKGQADLGCIFVVALILKALTLTLVSQSKRSLLKAPYQAYPPEALVGIISRSLFWWLNSLLKRGHRQILSFKDLFDTDPELSSRLLQHTMGQTWERYRARRGKNSLLLACINCLRQPLLSTILPRLCVIGFKFSQSLLSNRAISLLGEGPSRNKTFVGRMLILATALVYLGLAITTAQYRHKIYRIITMMRGSLICLIFDATLHLDAGEAGESAAVTLMSTDIDRVALGLELSDNLWAAPIEIGIAIFLLECQLGLACLAPVGMTIGMIFTRENFAQQKFSAYIFITACTFGSFQVGGYAVKTQKI